MEQLTPQQMFFIELIEDARVEYNAIKQFPGLKNLWLKVIKASKETADLDEKSTAFRLEQLALKLMDRDYPLGDDVQLMLVVDRFYAEIEDNLTNEKWSWDLGILLHNALNISSNKWG